MSYQMNLGGWNSIFAVPSAVVDKHLKLAGAAHLKVLLWTLRHAGENFEAETVAAALSMQPADVRDAMQYWIETGLLVSAEDTLSPAQPEQALLRAEDGPFSADEPSLPAASSAPKSSHTRLLSRPQKPESAYVAQRMAEAKEISFLMQEAQVIFGRPISGGDAATLLLIHEYDGLPVEVIVMLLQYAVGIGKNSMRYIEKMAISWAEEEIDSPEKAEQKIRTLEERKRAWFVLLRTLGMEQRSPTAKEDAAANKWINDWHFGESMIREAYERCVDAKGKFILSYMDKILCRWHSEGISTPEQAGAEKAERSSRSLEKERQPSYDLDKYEKMTIFDEIGSLSGVKK